MHTVAQATALILENAADFGAETVPLRAAAGRVLREPILADRDFPPFTRVAMDGIALRFDSFAAGRRSFVIEGILAAGRPQPTLREEQGCYEVMTGAILPAGADTVVRYEDIQITDGTATVLIEDVKRGQHAQAKGSERHEGNLLIASDRRLSPAEIGVAATVGMTELAVARLPRTVIGYSGDELVDVGTLPLTHQIRASNPFTIAAALAAWGAAPDLLHLPDDEPVAARKLQDCLDNYELLLLSGGVSQGKFDFMPATLRGMGLKELVFNIRQRPGKPFWFGRHPGTGAAVFALPGNPVASFLCTLRYVLPWLRRSLGLTPYGQSYARLSERVHYEKKQTYFLPARLSTDPSGQLVATPLPGQGSGDLANLADADGFLELPPEPKEFEVGETFRFWSYR